MNTETRLAMLETHLAYLKASLSVFERMEAENPDADLECVCGTIEDSISSVEHQILCIDDWARDQVENDKANRADHDRDARLMGDY